MRFVFHERISQLLLFLSRCLFILEAHFGTRLVGNRLIDMWSSYEHELKPFLKNKIKMLCSLLNTN